LKYLGVDRRIICLKVCNWTGNAARLKRLDEAQKLSGASEPLRSKKFQVEQQHFKNEWEGTVFYYKCTTEL